MARQIIPVIGAGVGFLFGGPTGAQIGWAVGSAVGNVVDPQVLPGPRIGEISQQTSQEGGARPIVFALSPPMAGNVIATSEPNIVRSTQSQGKGGPKVETESVYRTYAVGVCEGPIGGFWRIWRNGILIYDVSDDPALTTAENDKFLETGRLFTGAFDQDPSPDLESVFGLGTTPAHRGTAYMVQSDEDLTDLRGAIPQWTFQVQRCEEEIELTWPDDEVLTTSGNPGIIFDINPTPPGDFLVLRIGTFRQFVGIQSEQFVTVISVPNLDTIQYMVEDIGSAALGGGGALNTWRGGPMAPTQDDSYTHLRTTVGTSNVAARVSVRDAVSLELLDQHVVNWTLTKT